MDLFKMGQDLLGDKVGDMGGIMDALSGLTDGNGLDLAGITDKLKEGGLGDQLSSWLGDGENAPVSADQLTNALGADKIGEMASKLGVDASAAAETLSQAMPSLLDKFSSGGNLLESVTGGNDPMDMVKNLFGK
ncbi:YidB family protein [Granulosicoccus sp. 3-233]|uniref:YidB family protein n=1 Tax=Granulosicoccus sp. 3-233 TaxID=3417969 RepID=UPI003D33A808